MYQRNRLIRTKLTYPKLHARLLLRSRLTTGLRQSENYRLTMVQAGTGYGKSTAVAALQNEDIDLVWYSLDKEDGEPLTFLTHLVHGLSKYVPSLLKNTDLQLENWQGKESGGYQRHIIDEVINELASHINRPLYLVLEDVHVLNGVTETLNLLNRLIDRCPNHLQPVLITRYPLNLPYMLNWQMYDEVLLITEEELAFTADEIRELFLDTYAYSLSEIQVAQIMQRIEGWPIALPLIWQKLRRSNNQNEQAVAYALDQIAGSTGQLFTYLTQEILAQQPPEIYSFLQVTPVLRQMTAELCDQLRNTDDSEVILNQLRDNNLFVIDLENGISRYHHMFRGLLYSHIPPEKAREMHLKAAEIYAERLELEEAFYHFISAEAYDQAAAVTSEIGRQLVRAGRLDTLQYMVTEIPEDVRHQHPRLWVYLGHIARLRGRTDDALAHYEMGILCAQELYHHLDLIYALRGKARLYLDTANPTKANRILQEILELSETTDDHEGHVRVLELMAENMLNQGRVADAEKYRAQAEMLRRDDGPVTAVAERLYLRSGKLWEARRLLENRWEQEQTHKHHVSRAHRETTLLLSLILSYQGEQEQAIRFAQAAGERGADLQSPYITAASLNRLGIAHLLSKNEKGYAEAQHCFDQAIQLCNDLDIPRRKVEALIGLCQIHGFAGDVDQALRIGEEAIELAQQVGDDWVAGWARLMIGASFALSADYGNSNIWLDSAYTVFEECQDVHGLAATLQWRCFVWFTEESYALASRAAVELLHLVRDYQFDFLFTQTTLYGPPDPRILIPFLLAIQNGSLADRHPHVRTVVPIAQRLMSEIGLAKLESHPGYQLRIYTLGAFRVWRGRDEILAGDWKRQKARQLFQLLITFRQSLLEREQIIDILWPELDPEGGQRDFKIAYTTLCKVLEPARGRKSPSAYVIRDGSRYGLRAEADLWLDVQQFNGMTEQGDRHYDSGNWEEASDSYTQALHLYEGDYLQEYPYEEWSGEERERLTSHYLRMSERLASSFEYQERWHEVINICEHILAKDDCWEEAYRLMMRAYTAQGQRPQALRVYQRCVTSLMDELGVDPAHETMQLHQEILQNNEDITQI